MIAHRPDFYVVPHDPNGLDPLDLFEREESDMREVYLARHFIPKHGPDSVNRVAAVLLLLALSAVTLMQMAGQS